MATTHRYAGPGSGGSAGACRLSCQPRCPQGFAQASFRPSPGGVAKHSKGIPATPATPAIPAESGWRTCGRRVPRGWRGREVRTPPSTPCPPPRDPGPRRCARCHPWTRATRTSAPRGPGPHPLPGEGGYSEPRTDVEVVDPNTGRVLAVAGAFWEAWHKRASESPSSWSWTPTDWTRSPCRRWATCLHLVLQPSRLRPKTPRGGGMSTSGRGPCGSTSVQDISVHSAPDLHVHHARMHSAQPFLVRDYLD